MRRDEFPAFDQSINVERSRVSNWPERGSPGHASWVAADDLERYARRLLRVAECFPCRLRPEALDLMGARSYLFEQNRQRWPDGRYHLLDRGYGPWRKHEIALTLEEAKALHVVAWGKTRAVKVGFADAALPLMDDVFMQQPGEWLAPLAGLLQSVARHVEARERAA